MAWLWSDGTRHPRILYTYLDPAGLPALLSTGELRPQRLVLGHRPLRLAPLVWLTDDLVPTSPAARFTAHASAEVIATRLTVATSAALRWPTWAAKNRVSRRARRRIERATEGLSERLWVTPAAIQSMHWISA
jgi:hypothetical protein